MSRIFNHPIIPNIENRKEVKFFFNSEELTGYEGEPVSSALFANGVKEFSENTSRHRHLGIFCANGQCAQCSVIINGAPMKSCITPLKAGMKILKLVDLPELPSADAPIGETRTFELKCDVLIIGGGPAGLTASLELANLGFKVVLVDDKDKLGGKLLLQTHKFFGSIEDCYAGTRGFEIGELLDDQAREHQNITVLDNTSIIGVFNDKKAGAFKDNKNYYLISFEGLIVSAGARERSLVFPGNDLPGVYGAGAFQTLVNRDLVKSSDRVFIIGSGNVGLIAAYHALQAGIEVAGIVDIMDKPSGYKVHADKIKRMGVPIYLKHTVLSAQGDKKVEQITIAEVNDKFEPMLDTAKTFSVDTILVAVGLASNDEFFKFAEKFDFPVIKAGDADEIAEASSAMFGGRVSALKLAKILGKNVDLNESFYEKMELLKSRPGKVSERKFLPLTDKFAPTFHCVEEIPCNPCTSVCPKKSVNLVPVLNNIMDLPELTGDCTGCGLCVAICPGLAITLSKKIADGRAESIIPFEFIPEFKLGDSIPIMDLEGEYLENGIVKKITHNKKHKTYLITVELSEQNAQKVAGIRVQEPETIAPLQNASFDYLPNEGVVCRCEGVKLGEIVQFIKDNEVRDINQLKQIRVGMGACGNKTCPILLPRIFKMAGVDWNEVTDGSKRPLSVEMPMFAIINEDVEAK